MTRPGTRAARTKAARERAAGHPTACTCDAQAPTNGEWFRIRNFVDQPNRAAIYIYEEIGYWGTSANEFVQQLNALNVDQLDVHINSPGGEVDDGLAIFNALRQHRAHVTVYIDGLAASAASFIACAGDEVLISEFAQVMIHDAMGIEFGNAAELRAFADLLDRYSDNIAGIYAQQAGGTSAQWREPMRAETWYTGTEAVAAGLADRVYDLVVAEDDDSGQMVAARWDMSLYAFRFQGRAAAPAPQLAAAGAPVVLEIRSDGTRSDDLLAQAVKDAVDAVRAGHVGTEGVVLATEAEAVPDVSHEADASMGRGEVDVESDETTDAAETGAETGDLVPETESDAPASAVTPSDTGTDVTAPDTNAIAGGTADVTGATDAADGSVDATPDPASDPWAELTAPLTAPPSPDDEFARLTEALKGA
jgi:ATP-dependent protease ClpP protease subunit